MTKFLLLLLAVVWCSACSLPDKNHCEVASDCLGGQVCRAGVCETTADDACGAGHAHCAADATCVDSPSGAACMCNAGFSGDGLSCADIDECAATTSPCAAHAACTNVTASFSCACESGFTGDGKGYCVPTRFTKIAAASGFSCGLAADGGIYCWGANVLGSLGDGTIAPHARPVQVGTATGWIDVAAHDYTGCGLRADQSLWCWGAGSRGQLGDGAHVTEYAPTQVVSDKPGVGWKAVSVGKESVCGLHLDGSAACWGIDRTGDFTVAQPAAVDDNTDWTAISVGTVRCGLRGSPGHLFCWGSSRSGDLGQGTTNFVATPTQVTTELWRTVEVGAFNACAINVDGTLWCWGNNPLSLGALVLGNEPDRVGDDNDWEAISLSGETAIGLRAGGHAYVWGLNDGGQLGLPIVTEVAAPTPIGGPVAVWDQISAGNVHGCGVADGQAYCWGRVGEGYLGNGASTLRLTPAQVGTDHWSAIASNAGEQCGLRSDGALLCRGLDSFDGVGLGDLAPAWTPTRIGSDTWSALAGSASAAGDTAMCAIRGGQPCCWGDNLAGEAGIGSLDSPQLSPVAVHVPADTQWSEIAVSDHACAIQSTGALWCWGRNDVGQLGNGASGSPVLAPTSPIAGTWLHVAVTHYGASGLSMTCAIKADHTLWCWGTDQLTMSIQHTSPTQVGSDDHWAQITMAPVQTSLVIQGVEVCGIKTDGTLWCWGVFSGNGTAPNSPTPVRVGTATDWKSVAAGTETCAIKTGGTLWCWGNSYVLGDGSLVSYDATQFAVPALVPTQIGTDTDWSTATTAGTTCATKTDGTLWCWGFAAAAEPDAIETPTPIR